MPRLATRHAPAAITAAAAIALTAPMLTQLPAMSASQPSGYGPSAPFDDALMGEGGPAEPMKNLAKIVRTNYGYRLTAGQQNSRITVKLANGKLRFRDEGTGSWKSLPPSCRNVRSPGVTARCAVPRWASRARPVLLEIHPRLGNDRVNGGTLPASFEMAVLADAGRDVVTLGAGNDFVNGAQDSDRVYGGAGNDWMRGGTHGDVMRGQGGNDYMVGQDGRDSIDGGAGTDRIYQ